MCSLKIESRFDYTTLPPNKREMAEKAAKDINEQSRKGTAALVNVGMWLEEMKGRLGRVYEQWVMSEFTFSLQTARNYRRMYVFMKRMRECEGEEKSKIFLGLHSAVLNDLAAPTMPGIVHKAVLAALEKGEKVTSEKIKALRNQAEGPGLVVEASKDEKEAEGSFNLNEMLTNTAKRQGATRKRNLLYNAWVHATPEVLNDFLKEYLNPLIIPRLKELGYTVSPLSSAPQKQGDELAEGGDKIELRGESRPDDPTDDTGNPEEASGVTRVAA